MLNAAREGWIAPAKQRAALIVTVTSQLQIKPTLHILPHLHLFSHFTTVFYTSFIYLLFNLLNQHQSHAFPMWSWQKLTEDANALLSDPTFGNFNDHLDHHGWLDTVFFVFAPFLILPLTLLVDLFASKVNYEALHGKREDSFVMSKLVLFFSQQLFNFQMC